MAPRCRDYLHSGSESADIVIRAELYRSHPYPPNTDEKMIAYMESCIQFCRVLPDFDGLYLHASAVVVDGRAYLFSGHSGAGKSTHTRLWQQLFGADARVINDDKPVLRRIDGKWIAYGTPWCGKDGINLNESAPLAGICYLKKGQKNEIRTLSKREAMERILAQTIRKFPDAARLDQMLRLMEQLLAEIPVYELENLPQVEAAQLSFETMRRGAQEAGL